MSSSEPTTAAPQLPTAFLVTSDPTVQITVYDATRTLCGQAEGSLRLQLVPGLYRVHFERGGRVHHEIVDHAADTDLKHDGPPWQSPVPFAGAASSHDDYIAPAEQCSVADTAPPLGPGPHDSRLFVFVRRAARDGSPRRLPSEPVTLHDADGRPLAAITGDHAVIDHEAGYVAYACRATPGTYRLRGVRSQRDAAITVPAGRTAQVFLSDTGSLRLADLRLALVPIGARFDPRSPIWGAMEGVIAALRVPDRPLPLAARVLLPDAIDDDLCFGLAAAHVLWRSGDRPGLAALMRHLARYPEIPDVAILGRLDDSSSASADGPLGRSPAGLLDTPPLLRASLTLALTRPELDPGTLSAYSAFAHAARTPVHDSVWCVWSTRTWDERWIEPAVERLREHDRQRDASSIARSLALATETVEQALEAIDATSPGAPGRPLEARDLAIPGYVLDRPLGRGARSTVHRARRQADGQDVALKLVPVPGGADGCARAHAALEQCPPTDHPQLLAATARGTLPGETGIWLEMELCNGSALDRLSEEEAPLALPEAHRLALEALAVLAHLHERGVAHGDLKPGNLLLRGDRSVAIAGPGLAVRRAIPAELRYAIDTPRLTPPELLHSDEPPTPATDVWAMAAMYYFLLTLEYPRDEYADQSQLEAALDNPIVSIARRRPDLPSELVHAIDAALSPIREARPRDAGAFRQQLAAIDVAAARAAEDADPEPQATGPEPQATRPEPRRPGPRSPHTRGYRVPVAIGVVAVAVIGWLVWPAPRPPSDRHAELAALVARADALRGSGDVRAAQDALVTALDLVTEPCDRGWIRLKSSLFLIDAGQDSLAMAQLNEAEHGNETCGDPNLADAVSLNKAWLLRRPDPAAAGTRLDALSRSAGEQPQALLLRSYLAADRGDLGEADRYLDRAERFDAPDPDWQWAIEWARAEISEQRRGVLDDVLAEYHYRRATSLIAGLHAAPDAQSPPVIASRRGPYDGLIALLARQGRWNDVLSVVLQLGTAPSPADRDSDASDLVERRLPTHRSLAHNSDATDMEPAAAYERVTPQRTSLDSRAGDASAAAPASPWVREVVSAWQARDLVIIIAPSHRRIGSGHERAYRVRIADGQVTGEDVGDASRAIQLATALFEHPADREAARALGAMMIPAGAETRALHVLALGALGRAPLAALRDATGALIIARRPLTRVVALGAARPSPVSSGRAVVLGDPLGNLPGAAVERAVVARAVGANALIAGAGTSVAATRPLLWNAHDAELLHVAAPILALRRSHALQLADGMVEPAEMVRHGVAPRIAVLTGSSSAAMDDEGGGSLASALLDAGTEIVLATDRSVEDAAALSLMTDFYAQPDWRADPARALARVQVAMDAKHGAPAGDASRAGAWAAFGALGRPPVIRGRATGSNP